MDLFSEITFVIYTYNRPAYLKRTLNYFDSFGLNLNFIIADSSPDEIKLQNKKVIDELKHLKVRLINHFDSEFPPYQKCLEALKQVETKFAVFSPDDDFLSLNGVKIALDFLIHNLNYVAAEGKNIFIHHRHKLNWIPGDVFSSIESGSALQRFKDHAKNYQPTFYAVHYTKFLIQLFEEALQSGCIEYPFGEFQPSFSTVIQGKVKRLDIFYGARDHTDEFNRKIPPTNWIQKFKDENLFEAGYKKYKNILIEHLVKSANLTKSEAEKAADKEMAYFFKQQETKPLIKGIKKITPRRLYNTLFYKSFLYLKWYKMGLNERSRMQKLLGESKDWEKMKEFVLTSTINLISFSTLE